MSIDHWYYSSYPEAVSRSNADAARNPFIWKTQKGELYYIEDMDTNHLFNTARMLYNNALVPPAFRVLDPDTGTFIRHLELLTWDPDYIVTAYGLMIDELNDRAFELDQKILDQLDDMDDNIEFLCGLNES